MWGWVDKDKVSTALVLAIDLLLNLPMVFLEPTTPFLDVVSKVLPSPTQRFSSLKASSRDR
jgi:hypothetical protein